MRVLDATVSQGVATPTDRIFARCYSIRWACVYTQPQAETWAKTNLELVGYRVWFPTRTVRQRDPVIPTKVEPVERPLFPRYGFIAFDHRDTSWSPIRDTPGVVDLVRCGSLPAYTSDTVVRVLRSALDASQAAAASIDTQDARRRVGAAVAPGNRSPFAGHPAVIISVTGNRAVIAIVMFGQVRHVSVDVNSLVARE